MKVLRSNPSVFPLMPIAVCTVAAATMLHGSALSQLVQPNIAQAAPQKSPARQPSTLSFRMTARFAQVGAQGAAAAPEQMITARVHLRGNRVRVESQLSDRTIVVLYAPPYVYRLLPSSKAGVRYQINARTGGGLQDFDPQTLFSNPVAIRAALKQQGARRTGSTQLNGVAVDIYETNNFRGKARKVKAWLRRSDALPVRMEMTTPQMRVAASWRDYKRSNSVSNSLFTVPQGYRIRNAQGQLILR